MVYLRGRRWHAGMIAAGVAALLAAGMVSPASTNAAADQPTPRDAMATVEAMQPGWNLGNSFDAIGDDETALGNPRVTQQLLDHVRAQGYNSIRIPVTWSSPSPPAP